MSAEKTRQLIQQYGPNYSTTDLRRIWGEMTNPENGDVTVGGKRKSVDAEEAQLFTDLAAKPMTEAGRRLYATLKARLPQEMRPDNPPPPNGDVVQLTPANAKKPVFLNQAGWPVSQANITGQPNNAQAEDGFYNFALLVSQSFQLHGGRVPALASVPLATKQTLANNAISMIERSLGAGGAALDGLSAEETKQLRSSAFTVLYQICKDLPSEGNRLKLQIQSAMMGFAEREPERFLGQHMVRVMDRPEYKASLSSAQRAEVESLFAEKVPQKFDPKNIMSEDGYILWTHRCGEGEEFYRSFIANMDEKSVHGARFRKVREDSNGVEYELSFPSPRGEAQIKGIRMSVKPFRDDMFDDVGKGRGFSYGGHSNIGNNQERSMARALERGLRTDKPQLAVLDLCAGLDNLDDNIEKLGNLEVLTTFGSSFFWKGTVRDENGSFQGVTDSEGDRALMAVFTSLTADEGFEQMRKRVNDEISSYSHERNPNVVFPTLKDYREVRWAHLDGDNDGRADANDILFQFGLKSARRSSEHPFALRFEAHHDELTGDPLRDAVLEMNVATHYNSEMGDNRVVEHKFVGNGYFDGTDSAELMRFRPGDNHDGTKVFLVEYNHGLAHTKREPIGALTQYLGAMYMADEGHLRGISEVDRKLMALNFAMFRMNFDGASRYEDQATWKELLQAVRLPSDLPFGPLAQLVDAEHHDYSGSMTIVNQYKRSLGADQLRALESRDVGRPGSGPPIA